MSGLVSQSNFQVFGAVGFNVNEDVLQPVDYRVSPPMVRSPSSRENRFSDFLWPRPGFLGNIDGGQAFPYIMDGARQYWEWDFLPTGGHVPKKVIGQTLNNVGTPVANVTVMLFNTATNLIVDVQTSDAGGNYQLNDPNATTNYVVAYLPGSPDVSGTTVDTLTGV